MVKDNSESCLRNNHNCNGSQDKRKRGIGAVIFNLARVQRGGARGLGYFALHAGGKTSFKRSGRARTRSG